jgi:hypothetical protein
VRNLLSSVIAATQEITTKSSKSMHNTITIVFTDRYSKIHELGERETSFSFNRRSGDNMAWPKY